MGKKSFYNVLLFLFLFYNISMSGGSYPNITALHGEALPPSFDDLYLKSSRGNKKNETLSSRIYLITLNSVGMDTGSFPGGGIYSSAAAVSKIISQALEIPLKIPYIADLYDWLRAHAILIKKPSELISGDIIISPSSRDVQGHVGIIGEMISERPDFAIYSNSLDSCLFLKNWTLSRWREYFEKDLKLNVYYFRLLKPLPQSTSNGP
ncbi:hypothetical protein A946_06135 [Methylacidiphilum kamchatkense Kam1]|uniref:CHAP domain-containing protein n=1 Tax=Methylacidiphilum kamchatkense Kam1 TaxID=1202785 RepID=A0A0C1UPY8_9BACT|nr:hypothetical protein [Methylacidiphilum kamchatkense]KIE58469.1 hypothetical protein A946_06135 [Methylacidiphilum kamchatkense Kam1]QDQ43285.1 hypothetical protein kam1_2077 [Methylacidiphilum kamchatkense Kam1]